MKNRIVVMFAVALFLLPSVMLITGVSGLDSPKAAVEITDTPTTSVLRTTAFDAAGHKGIIAGENGTAFIFEEYLTKWINISSNASITFYGSGYRHSYDQFYLLGYNSTSGKGIMKTLHYYRSGTSVRPYDIDTGHSLTIVSAGVTGGDDSWTPGREYVYESSSSSVNTGDIRCTDTPVAYIDNIDATGPVTLGSSSLSSMPASEHVTLTYSSANGTWDVRGSLSGLQTGKASTGSSFTFDTGINANRVEIYLSSGSPSDGDWITFNIGNKVRYGYPAGSTVSAGDTDVATPLTTMSEKVGKDARGRYYMDKDDSGSVSVADVRVSPYKLLFPRYTDRPERLTGIAFNATEGSGVVVGYGAQAYVLTSAANMAQINGISGVNFEDVTYVGGSGKGMYLAVGQNTTTNHPAFYLLDAENSTFYSLEVANMAGAPGVILTSIAWSWDNGYGLTVGSNGNYYKVVKKAATTYNLESMTLPSGFSSTTLTSVRWIQDPSDAVISGYGGALFVYHAESGRTVSLPTNTTSNLFAVGVREEASPGFTYVVGSGGTGLYYSYSTDTSSTVTANVYYPHISNYSLTDEHGFDIDNRMTDVDSNISIAIQGYYEKGWSEIQVDFYAWYDNNGKRDIYDINESAAGNSTRAIHLRYTGGSNGSATGTWSLIYPLDLTSYGFGQTANITNQSESVTSGSYEYHNLFMNISLGPQMFRSLNDDMTFVNDTSAADGFNDPDTWNYQIVMADASVPTSNDTIYSEFGLYQYTAITVSGAPSGAAAPGTTNLSLCDPSILTYSTNTYYKITASVTDLTDGAGHSIPASNIGVINWDGNITGASEMGYDSGWPVHFSAADTPRIVWGNSSHYLGPGFAGNYTYSTWPAFTTQDSPHQLTSGDIDVGRHVTNFPYLHGRNGNSGTEYYYDIAGNWVVDAGDIRLTRITEDTYDYPAYSVVQPTDQDCGVSINTGYSAVVTGPDEQWTHGEAIYIGTGGTVQGNELRITDFSTTIYWYLDIPVSTPEGTYTGVITYTILHQ